MSSSSGEDKGFKVTDRRVSIEDDGVEAAEPAEAAASTSADAPQAPHDHGHDHSAHEAPPADFNTLVLSLSTSALMYLGLVAGPDGQPAPKNLPLARHSIDLLAMLEEKTKGNLSGEEELLLGEVLYDLRMHFLSASKS